MRQKKVTSQAKDTLNSKHSNKKFLFFGVFLVLACIAGVFTMSYQKSDSHLKAVTNELKQEQGNLIFARAKDIEKSLTGIVDSAKKLANSNIYQLFASEVDKLDTVPVMIEEPSLNSDEFYNGDQPGARLPLMRSQLQDFISYAAFSDGVIVNSRGEAYITTATVMPVLSDSQKSYVENVVSSGSYMFSEFKKDPKGFIIELYVPIFAPSFEGASKKPVSVLVLTKQMNALLAEYLFSRVENTNRTVHLIQKSGSNWQEIILGEFAILDVNGFEPGISDVYPFELRENLAGTQEVFSAGRKIEPYNFWFTIEDNSSAILAEPKEYSKSLYIQAILFSFVLVLLISAAWWWLVGQEQKSINAEFQEFANIIEEQKKLLNGINNTITDPISLVDDKGVYKYVNKAFAHAVGRSEADVVGLDGTAVFGFDTARRLNVADQHVLMTGESVSIEDVLWLQSQKYYFQISKAPLKDSETKSAYGIVSVYRDITQLKEIEERGRRVVQQTIDALVSAIEQADPFLGGHSRIMGGIAGLIAKELRLSDADIATVQAAANLSQVGKMFVPREILLKPGVLTPDEKNLMEQHVEFTKNVLKDIEFDLPVVQVIYEMNELMDGKGYPKGLSGDEILLDARILAVANAFTAMARPRAYRPAIPVEDVLKILESQKGAYDQIVVEALRRVLATPAGERLVILAASGKAS